MLIDVLTRNSVTISIWIASVSLCAPPEPLLPRSLVVTVNPPMPAKPLVGVKVIPSSAALMFASVPVNVIVVFSVPLPTVKVSPERVESVTRPLVAVSVTRSVPPPPSMSEMVIWFWLAALKTSGTLMLVAWSGGMVFTGASLTALTVMLTESVSVLFPPDPVLPRSSVMI